MMTVMHWAARRPMTIGEVPAQSNRSLPAPLLRWIYQACVALLYIALCMSFASSTMYGSIAHSFAHRAEVRIGAARSSPDPLRCTCRLSM